MVRAIAPCLILLACAQLHAGCADSLVLENAGRLVKYDVDTTGHWWAITQPYEQFQLLVVDGKPYGTWELVGPPVFAYDGSTWAAIGVRSQQWVVIRPDDTTRGNVMIEAIAFPSQSSTLWWVEYDGANRLITNGERSYRTGYEARSLCLDPQGLAVSWIENQSGTQVIMQNGREVARGNDARLAGVWADGRCLYAIRYGPTYSIKLGQEELASQVRGISSFTLNPFGNIAAWQATDAQGQVRTYMYTDEYLYPWEGPIIGKADDKMALNPFFALVAYRASLPGGGNAVGYNAAMYIHGVTAGPPTFSHDGAVMAYTSMDNGNFVVVNGKRFIVKAGVPINDLMAIAHSGNTVAWRSVTTLVVVDVELNTLQMGRMCDVMGRAIFNRSTNTFMALGEVTGRLFLLSCASR